MEGELFHRMYASKTMNSGRSRVDRFMLRTPSIGVTTRVASSLRRSAGVKRISWLVLTLGLVVPSVASADGFEQAFSELVGATPITAHTPTCLRRGRTDGTLGAADFLSFCLQLDSPLRPEQYFDTSMPSHLSAVRSASNFVSGNQELLQDHDQLDGRRTSARHLERL